MRRWASLPLTLLFACGLALPAWANSELHPGARLFYPLWDVSTPNRLTFIIVTREALNDGVSIRGVGTLNNKVWTVSRTVNCIPRGAGGSTSNVNRSDLGGTVDNPVFVDDLHFEYYGKTCASADEVVHMSCADIDLFLLSSAAPRFAFQSVAGDLRGALDVHLVQNGTTDPLQRKKASSDGEQRYFNSPNNTVNFTKVDNSLMGHAIISDIAEGWAATYPAAAAKSTTCDDCGDVDGGTFVGYENYPMEVFIPFALAENFPTQGGGALRNLLSLWGPGLFPGANLQDTSINLDFKWWDGRERAFFGSVNRHALIATLGGPQIAGQDAPVDPSRFNISNFTCGHSSGGQAENDGFPRSGSSSTACGAPSSADTAHPSDNAESVGDGSQAGDSIQSSTPIAWWRFRMRPDNEPPIGNPPNFVHSGRGLVGVVLSSTSTATTGVGDVTRLWHKDPCEVSQSGFTWGPPHVRDAATLSVMLNSGQVAGDPIALFNVWSFDNQAEICEGSLPVFPPGFTIEDNL